MSGTLFVVATPLGNLGDLSPRAAETLRRVSLVVAEDTRRTRPLLTHAGGKPRLQSFHAHSPPRRLAAILEVLAGGADVALVTDAGTPTVSDPGADLIAGARAQGSDVVVVPGPSAVTAALSGAGLPADRYVFLGFLPRKGPDREALVRLASASALTVVLFEAPTRLAALLADLAAAAGATRRAVVARELTKVHEEFRDGTLGDLAVYYEAHDVRGEVTVVVEGRVSPTDAPPDETAMRREATRLLAEGVTRRDAVRILMDSYGLTRNDAYRLVTAL